jgi:hypothetical protein
VQYLWLSLKKEKESQEKNNQKESQEEKEIRIPNRSSLISIDFEDPLRAESIVRSEQSIVNRQ